MVIRLYVSVCVCVWLVDVMLVCAYCMALGLSGCIYVCTCMFESVHASGPTLVSSTTCRSVGANRAIMVSEVVRVPHGTARHGTARRGTARSGTERHGITHRSAARHGRRARGRAPGGGGIEQGARPLETAGRSAILIRPGLRQRCTRIRGH